MPTRPTLPRLEPSATRSRQREDIGDRYKWNLTDIFPDWEAWDAGYKRLEAGIEQYAALKGTLAGGADRLLDAFRLSEELGQLAYRVWYFPSLRYDEDQRDNTVNAKRQQVQILFARWKQAESWFNPELLKIPLATVREWMDTSEPLRLYRFAIEDLYRQQEHVLDEAGERLMSLSSRLASAPNDCVLGALDGRREVPDGPAVDRRRRDGVVRAVPRDPGDAAGTVGSRGGVPRAARDLSEQPQHLRDALQRRLPARLVPGAGARLQDARSMPRCTATTSRRRWSRTSSRRRAPASHRCSAITGCGARRSACRRITSTTIRSRS